MSFAYTEPRDSLGNIQTPPYVAEFLYRLVKHLKPKVVLDPSCGLGNLLQPWFKAKGVTPIGIDTDKQLLYQTIWPLASQRLHQPFENTYQEQLVGTPDLVLLNPPWNRHWSGSASYPEVFLRKVVDLWGPKIPIVFLCPMGFRLNQQVNSKRRKWVSETLEISSIISCPRDMYPKTEFHNEIILFNVKRVKPHYWMPEPPDNPRFTKVSIP